MMDAAAGFFDDLGRRGREPLLAHAKGTVRVDLSEGDAVDHYLVFINDGTVAVAHETGDGDCIVYADRAMFNDIVSGKANAMAALLRGEMDFEGDSNLVVKMQRLFPGPSASRGDDMPASSGRSPA
jgi:putative sterol carrier protein